MKTIDPAALRLLALATLLGASACPAAPQPLDDVRPPSPASAASPDMRPFPAERFAYTLPDDPAQAERWRAACGVIAATLRADPGTIQNVQRIDLGPLRDPEGNALPFLVEVRMTPGPRSVQLVHEDAFVPLNAGQQAAEAHLRALGFPRTTRLSRHLLGELLRYYGVLVPPFYDLSPSWALLDATWTDQGLPLPLLTYAEDGTAELHVEARVRPAGPGGGAVEPRHLRRILRFDADARITIRDLQRVDAADGPRWEAAPTGSL